MASLIPDLVFRSVYEITPEALQAHGIKGVLFDIDGTVASAHSPLPSEQFANYMKSLQQAGLKLLFLSNNSHKRVSDFCASLGIDFVSRAKKPFLAGFRRALQKLSLPHHQIAMVGDQLLTDILGGSRAGLLTCYVDTIDHKRPIVAFRLIFERPFIEKGRRRGGAHL